MASGELVVLDVGHGNCAIVRHGADAVIIDAPGKSVVARALDELGVAAIHALIISHADGDHLSGAIPLLMNAQRPVRHVYVNPDDRSGTVWRRFRVAVGDARKRGTQVHATLNRGDPYEVLLGGTRLSVLNPTPEMCLATVNGRDGSGVRLDPNGMSAVVLVEHEGERICLLAADANRYSLDAMLDENINLSAPVLVFPHHGGHAGTHDNQAFARELVEAVKPDVVLFSLGRGAHGTPRAEIVRGVNEGMSKSGRPPYVACTQLSLNCASALPAKSDRGLDKRSDGYKKNFCCAGTVTIPLRRNGMYMLLQKLAEHHGIFVSNTVPNALCQKRFS